MTSAEARTRSSCSSRVSWPTLLPRTTRSMSRKATPTVVERDLTSPGGNPSTISSA